MPLAYICRACVKHWRNPTSESKSGWTWLLSLQKSHRHCGSIDWSRTWGTSQTKHMHMLHSQIHMLHYTHAHAPFTLTPPYHAMPYLPCPASTLCPSDRRMHSAALIRLHHPAVRRTGGCRTTRLHYRLGPMRPHTWTSGHAHDAVTSGIV